MESASLRSVDPAVMDVYLVALRFNDTTKRVECPDERTILEDTKRPAHKNLPKASKDETPQLKYKRAPQRG